MTQRVSIPICSAARRGVAEALDVIEAAAA
jgi:hypothetical protein